MKRIVLAMLIAAALPDDGAAADADHWRKMYLSCVSTAVMVNAHRSCIPPSDLLIAAKSECSGSLKLATSEIETSMALSRSALPAALQKWFNEVKENDGKTIANAVYVQINQRRCP